MKVWKTLRNHWKKSLFGVAVLSSEHKWCLQKYRDDVHMREMCDEARRYGDEPLAVTSQPRHVTVVINPAANGGKSVAMFEKWCAPLLHLAGLKVAVVRTERPGETGQLLQMMSNTDAVLVAGGNGTVVEAVSGLMRRHATTTDATGELRHQSLPMAILPLGATNCLAARLFDGRQVRQLTSATMAAVRQTLRTVDVIQVTPQQQESDGVTDTPPRAIYLVSDIWWGPLADLAANTSRYWYWGPLQQYLAPLFTALFNKEMTWQCRASLQYCLQCAGCVSCHQRKMAAASVNASEKQNRSWWRHLLRPVSRQSDGGDTTVSVTAVNPDCGVACTPHSLTSSECRLMVRSDRDAAGHVSCVSNSAGLRLCVGTEQMSGVQFVREAWCRVRRAASGGATSASWHHATRHHDNCDHHQRCICVDRLTLEPSDGEKGGTGRWIWMDGEQFETRPFHARLLPAALQVFAPPASVAGDASGTAFPPGQVL